MKKNKNEKNKRESKNVPQRLSFSLFHLPHFDNNYIIFLYNSESQSIEICQMNEEPNKLLKYSIEDYPIEKCGKCSCELMINNSYYLFDNKNIVYYCSNCLKDAKSINKLENKEVDFSQKSNDLLNKLNCYLEKNRKNAEIKFVDEMEKLIKLTKAILYFLDLLEKEKSFEIQVLYLQNFRDNFIEYFDIVNKIEMNDLYLFLKNLCVIAIYKYSNNFLSNFMEYIYEEFINFNISEIQVFFINNLFNKVRKEEKVINHYKKIYIKVNNLQNKVDLNDANIQYLKLENSLIQNTLLAFKNESKIKEIKNELSDYLRNYFQSFNFIFSKKVLERKLINSIIFLLFKNQYSLFDKVEFTDYINNSIINELKNIRKFLEKSNINIPLYNKISKEIDYFETFKSSQDNGMALANPKSEIECNHVFLTLEEKKVLQKYSSSNFEESFTSIHASKTQRNPVFDPEKLQIILDFLFFVKDKTIDTIDILNKKFLLFFGYISENSLESQEVNKMEIQLTNIINDSDKDSLEELKNYSNPKNSNNADIINTNIFNSLKVNPKEENNSHSTFDYIFFYKPPENYKKEIKYLYENVVLPLEHVTLKDDDIDPFKRNYWKDLEEKIQYIYDKTDIKFKKDPNYTFIHKYLDNLNKNRKSNIPNIISFYEKYVNDFTAIKELHKLRFETKEKIKMIEEDISNLEKLKSIKERYKFIFKEINKHLIPNFEEYSKYYDEWKMKNPKFAKKDYGLKNLIKDLKILIPNKERIKIAEKDKRNFLLIVFLFQKNYFLKDYI